LLAEIETLWLDRGYDSEATRARLADRLIDDAIIAKRRKTRTTQGPANKLPMGLRWPVERTNSWQSNYGQLRRNTDRRTVHRLAQLALAVALLLTAKHRLAKPLVTRPTPIRWTS
jgi:transposase